MSWLDKTKSFLHIGEKKKEIPKGLWLKCQKCGEVSYRKILEQNLWVCPNCEHHFRVNHKFYINLLLDNGIEKEFDKHFKSDDPLKFVASDSYKSKYKAAVKKTGLNDGIVTGIGEINGHKVCIGVMEFGFMGGSMGSVVGEKVARLMRRATKLKYPVIIVVTSGGARMQEGMLSLMQMAKTSALVLELKKHKIPYINILTNPSTAGVMASYASLGDLILAEPGALLGFAGPRVIKQTIGQDLPEGFQLSEFFLKHGMIDNIISRKELKETLTNILLFFEG